MSCPALSVNRTSSVLHTASLEMMPTTKKLQRIGPLHETVCKSATCFRAACTPLDPAATYSTANDRYAFGSSTGALPYLSICVCAHEYMPVIVYTHSSYSRTLASVCARMKIDMQTLGHSVVKNFPVLWA